MWGAFRAVLYNNVHSRGDKHPLAVGELPKLKSFIYSIHLAFLASARGRACGVYRHRLSLAVVLLILVRLRVGRMGKCRNNFGNLLIFFRVLGFESEVGFSWRWRMCLGMRGWCTRLQGRGSGWENRCWRGVGREAMEDAEVGHVIGESRAA